MEKDDRQTGSSVTVCEGDSVDVGLHAGVSFSCS